ncbi:glycosyltransferase family 1 protein [Parabacteroides sp. AF48-14]|uniref:glycosyltransferase family protein n=1 Tax=Parabacteroides sp. AF48-14 TaxID=2292052 RepID=UPI000F00EAE8|nr:glycosyltransferase [Parabacteroides sp. AF48-14]RHO70009.1 glycosyltransferase family 1 protein [Parabacteroides sp. AF48-14]
MNILYYYRDSLSLMDSWQKIHFLDELRRMGHIVTIFNYLDYSNLFQANEEIIAKLKNRAWDFFMTAHGCDLLFPETIQEIRKLGIPSLLICFDNLHAPFMHKSIAPFFDLVWLTSFETKPLFEKWGCNCIFQPYAANPYTYFPHYGKEIKTVGFIGTPYGTRIEKINDLVNSNVNCTVYSDKVNVAGIIPKRKKGIQDYWEMLRLDFDLIRFPVGRKVLEAKYCKKILVKNSALNIASEYLNVYPSVSFEKMNELYSNFSLTLGITELWDTYVLSKPIHKLHLRTFEIPMCGGLQLVSYVNELGEYFEEDKEIIFYRSKDEFIEKATFYLSKDKYTLRQKMKLAARYRAEHEHTWRNRFENIFNIMGVDKIYGKKL